MTYDELRQLEPDSVVIVWSHMPGDGLLAEAFDKGDSIDSAILHLSDLGWRHPDEDAIGIEVFRDGDRLAWIKAGTAEWVQLVADWEAAQPEPEPRVPVELWTVEIETPELSGTWNQTAWTEGTSSRIDAEYMAEQIGHRAKVVRMR